jgi:hypothetical protein
MKAKTLSNYDIHNTYITMLKLKLDAKNSEMEALTRHKQNYKKLHAALLIYLISLI